MFDHRSIAKRCQYKHAKQKKYHVRQLGSNTTKGCAAEAI